MSDDKVPDEILQLADAELEELRAWLAWLDRAVDDGVVIVDDDDIGREYWAARRRHSIRLVPPPSPPDDGGGDGDMGTGLGGQKITEEKPDDHV